MKVSLGTVGDSWIKVPKLLDCIAFTRNAKVDVAEIIWEDEVWRRGTLWKYIMQG